MSRRGAIGIGVFGVALAGAVAGTRVPASAVEYPSWEDVLAAWSSEGAKAAEISRIQGLIAGLASEVTRTQNESVIAADAFYQAQQAHFDAAYRAEQLQKQADEQAAKATEAAEKAGVVAAELYRNGGDDTSLELFFSDSADTADNLLARLGTMDMLLDSNQAVYAEAVTARNSAQSLSNQAEVQRKERDRLQKIAEEKLAAAQAAAEAAQAALQAEQSRRIELEAQLEALRAATVQTVAAYQAGVEARRKAREEAERKAREEAERIAREQSAAAAAAAAKNNSGGAPSGGTSGGGASSGGNGGAVTSSGWARPSSGRRTSGYGPRTRWCGANYCSSGFHYGVDLYTGCGAAIYAAHAGRVVYAGVNSGYGNYIKIDHGGGLGTGYAHIRPGGIFVRWGQQVQTGQLIASEGNTGNSFGCHLHFETYVWGSAVNPADFMAARGISV